MQGHPKLVDDEAEIAKADFTLASEGQLRSASLELHGKLVMVILATWCARLLEIGNLDALLTYFRETRSRDFVHYR